MGFVLGDVENGQIHSAFCSFLQFVHEGKLSGGEDDSDILLDVAVEPFEEVVEYPLLAALEGEHICIFNHKEELLSPSFLELFV